jgi:Maltokinase N-terminal cap domain
MAIVHRAELRPSKVDLLSAWLPGQSWCDTVGDVERVAAFRFDDPAGEVGIETYVMAVGSGLFHVPMTYRGAPLTGGVLIGELDHSVLGHRWVYDGPSDPVYVDVIQRAIVDGSRDVDMVLDDGTPVPRLEWWADAVGSGVTGAQALGALTVARRLPTAPPDGAPTLTATWLGQQTPAVLAWLS